MSIHTTDITFKYNLEYSTYLELIILEIKQSDMVYLTLYVCILYANVAELIFRQLILETCLYAYITYNVRLGFIRQITWQKSQLIYKYQYMTHTKINSRKSTGRLNKNKLRSTVVWWRVRGCHGDQKHISITKQQNTATVYVLLCVCVWAYQ